LMLGAQRCRRRSPTQVINANQRNRGASKLWAKRDFGDMRRIGLTALAVVLMGAIAHGQESGQERDREHSKVITPDAPGLTHNHRLVLKDGSYQVVRKYQVVGDRVRYMSMERSGEWEELPYDLVDWDATKRWEEHHTGPYDTSGSSPSEAMKEAAELDKEEAAERDDQKARRPEVAKGLELPDQDGVFVLDTYQGTPELVEVKQSDLNLNQKSRKGLATLNPLAGSKASIELTGAHARAHLHVNDPEIFVSLEGRDDVEQVVSRAMTVKTVGAQEVAHRKHGAHSPQSGFAIVKLDERREVRIIGAIHVSPTGTVTQSEDVIPTQVEVLPGKHWLKLKPQTNLNVGEYALVEIVSPSDISQSVWDFRVDPHMGDNPGSLGPILK
jgi:hypothetical protein